MNVLTCPPTTRTSGDRLPAPLASALDRLACFAPDDAADAAVALGRALDPVRGSAWPEVAWRSSTLTGSGFPVELAWASRDTAVRWICEAAGPETPTGLLLARSAASAAALTGVPVETGPWSRLQHDQPLRWGAWLGMRHQDGRRAGKVYAELPPGAVLPRTWAAAGERLQRLAGGLVWRMVGLNDDGSVELYARVAVPPVGFLGVLGRVIDLDSPLTQISTLLAPGRPDAGANLPHPSGLSLAVAADGTPVAVTWFSFARAMWSTDALAMEAIAEGCRGSAFDVADGSVSRYLALASGPDDGRRRHAMVGVGVDRAGRSWLQAGVRPT